MIGYITGKVVAKFETKILIKTVTGLGYEVEIKDVNEVIVNDNVELFILHVIRENEQLLFGFDSLDDKMGVEKLLKVNGVGAKTAATIIYTLGWSEVLKAILNENFKTISSIKGLGAKTAKKIILELKGASTDLKTMNSVSFDAKDPSIEDFTIALTNIGYKKQDIIFSITKLKEENLWDSKNLGLMVKKALQILSGK